MVLIKSGLNSFINRGSLRGVYLKRNSLFQNSSLFGNNCLKMQNFMVISLGGASITLYDEFSCENFINE
jgi:hypothetical protein